MRSGIKWVLIWACCAADASAQDMVRVDRMQAAFDAWLATHDVKGVAAVAFAGDPIATLEGGLDKDVGAELASVSKSITALCATQLVDEGVLTFEDTVKGVMARGPDVSVAQLITHSGGLVDDITQSLMARTLDQSENSAFEVLEDVSDPAGPKGTYAYNNVNYALLGVMIEKATGIPYEDACRARVLEPAGVQGAASARSGASISWGGWEMSPEAYAKLHSHWFGKETETGRDPFAYPHVKIADGVYYGLGTVFRKSRDGHNFWHHGALCLPGRLTVGSFAVTWQSEWTVMVSYDNCVDWDAMMGLDLALGRAAYGALE